MTNLIALKGGTELVGDYRIERVLGAGGFGITYLAEEVALDRNVTIKEYFPSDFAARTSTSDAAPRSQDCASDYRWGLDRFIEEAQTLARFSHPNIVRVYRYFKANNTAYMVLHFEEGQSLKSWLKGLGRAPRQKELDAIVAPLLDALELIHKQDFLHRDIAPDNIIIRKDGTPVLIDFGSARGEILAHSKTVSALVKPGYSPYEQYAETSRQQGPWTDIYALAATLYHAVTGKRPSDSPSRMVKDELIPAREAALSAYRAGFLAAIDHALTLQIEGRPQSIAAWRGALLAPDSAKGGWFAKTPPRKLSDELAEVTPRAAAAKKAASSAIVPPPPDAPGPKGGMLDFLDGLKKKPTEPKPAPAPEKEAAKAAPPPAPAAAATPQAATEKLSKPPEPIKLPRVLRNKKEPSRELVVREPKKAEAKEKRKPASRPRPIRPRRNVGWRPILFKLLVGVGVASAAVAMQERFPQFESRGSGETTAGTTTTTANIRTASLQEVPVIRPLAELNGHVGAVTAIAYSSDGASLATVGADARLKIWNAGTNTLTRTIELDNGPATALALFGNNALTGHASGDVVLWDWQRAEKLAAFKRNNAEIWSVAFAGRADRFVAASHDWKLTLWDAATPSGPVQVIDAHESAAQAVAYVTTERGPRLASGGADKIVKLWNLDTLDRIRTYRGHKDFISALAFSPDGKLLASASLDGNIRVWSTTSGRLLRRLYGHRGRVGSLSFSPDGKSLASSGADGQLRIWDVSRGRTLRTIVGHTGAVNAASFAPDGERLASAGEDGIVRIWANPIIAQAVTN
ncbi:serine/threonine-protein kinase [Hyphomicrobium sp.]|uniref:WD40 repeat domain-containing serine/threonine protein kinase n=1 Tax=Hyphomicrobium sp. TaxID=82 RepID=UPI0025C0BF8D|nr:serine/threonine-protein kinase [Hyphomicrobium sp.]MCC7253314.1 serine/threonine protein kinase [Hyphomicrobium sp.]